MSASNSSHDHLSSSSTVTSHTHTLPPLLSLPPFRSLPHPLPPFPPPPAEPTTGLDSHTALAMVRCLKRLTSTAAREEKEEGVDRSSPPAVTPAPVTVILSIHQPNWEVFGLFDDLILLSGGHVLYCGPAAAAVGYFDALGLPCPAYTNPPEHLLDLAQGTTEDEQRTLQLLVKAYEHHTRRNDDRLLSLDSAARLPASATVVAPRPLPYHLQLLYLLRRSHLCVSRSPLLKIAQVLQSLVLGLLVGLSFIHLGLSQSSVQNRLGAVYFIILCTIFANTFAVVLTFAEERAVFMREQRSSMYSVSAYFIARTAVDAPPTLVCSVVFVCVSYFLMGLSVSVGQVLYFLLVVVLLAYCGQSIGLVVACAVPERLLAMILTPLSIAPFIVFTPYALPYPDSVPVYLLPFQYASPFWWRSARHTQWQLAHARMRCGSRVSVVWCCAVCGV